MKLREARPSGYRRGSTATRMRGVELEDVRTPIYAICPEVQGLTALRTVRKIGLRDAASAIGIRAIDLVNLERGRLVPEDPGDWARILQRLKEIVPR